MNAAERKALIDQYEDGFRAVSVALAEISEAELEAREAPGEWSPREIVHHLADSEMTSAIRLRLLIAQDAPTILGYDQEAFSGGGPAHTARAAPTRSRTGCASTAVMPTTTPTRSAAREPRWRDRRPQHPLRQES